MFFGDFSGKIWGPCADPHTDSTGQVRASILMWHRYGGWPGRTPAVLLGWDSLHVGRYGALNVKAETGSLWLLMCRIHTGPVLSNEQLCREHEVKGYRTLQAVKLDEKVEESKGTGSFQCGCWSKEWTTDKIRESGND